MKTLSALSDAGLRRALADYLLAVADDELIIGHRHSEWTGFAPDIESDVALSSIAQEEIGHAKLFYERVCELAGGDPDRLAFGRRPEEFRNAILVEHPNGDWGYSIVRLYLYDQADAVRLETLAGASLAPLADLAQTLRREEKYHQMYGEQWLRRLAEATPQSRVRLQGALAQVWGQAQGLFEPVAREDLLTDAGILPSDHVALHDRWRARTAAVLESAGLQLPADPGGGGGGGRSGRHSDALRILLGEMTSVWRSDPGASW